MPRFLAIVFLLSLQFSAAAQSPVRKESSAGLFVAYSDGPRFNENGAMPHYEDKFYVSPGTEETVVYSSTQSPFYVDVAGAESFSTSMESGQFTVRMKFPAQLSDSQIYVNLYFLSQAGYNAEVMSAMSGLSLTGNSELNAFTFFEGDPGRFSELLLEFKRQSGTPVTGSLFIPASFISYLATLNRVPVSVKTLRTTFTSGTSQKTVVGLQGDKTGGTVSFQDVCKTGDTCQSLQVSIKPHPPTGIWCTFDSRQKNSSASVFIRDCGSLKKVSLNSAGRASKRITLKACLWQGRTSAARNGVASFEHRKKIYRTKCQEKRG